MSAFAPPKASSPAQARDAQGGTSIWRHLPRPVHALAFYGCLGFLGALLLAGCALCHLLSIVLPARLKRDSGRAVISGAFRAFLASASAFGLVRLDLDALDALNAERGVVIAPNHPSMLDALLVVSRVRRTGCIMKAGLWDSPFLGAGARLADYIRNDSINSMIRHASADLTRGGKLLIFPEGTRTTAPPVNPLKGGIALIAQRAGAPIQTVLIETDSFYLRKGWPIWKMPQFPLCYRATLGPRIEPGDSASKTLGAMQAFYAGAPAPATAGTARSSRAPCKLKPS